MAPIFGTFLASLRSVGTACTMTAVGIYLHQRGFVNADNKRTLAVISQQVTFPLFLFTKIIYCNQDWSNEPCPDITRSLRDAWMLLFWPIYVVGIGILIGTIVSKLTRTPNHQFRSVLAACSFGNSTGLPITLLTVVHENFPSTSDLGRIDPTLFLSVYLLLYPVLQWGIGGWMLAPDRIDQQQEQQHPQQWHELPTKRTQIDHRVIPEYLQHHVLNNVLHGNYKQHPQRLSSADEGLYMSELDHISSSDREIKHGQAVLGLHSQYDQSFGSENGCYIDSLHTTDNSLAIYSDKFISSLRSESKLLLTESDQKTDIINDTERSLFAVTSWQTISIFFDRCFQPPVIGAILGIVFAITPIRGIFVDLVDRDSDAPLQFLFDGLYEVGQAAVPINMMILGCNLSASYNEGYNFTNIASNDIDVMSMPTMIGIVIGKMILMPFVGIATGWILKKYILDIPDVIDGSFYLVLMIVFITPTANNVMVMVELSGSGAKKGIASAIALQYAVAPIILSISMTVAIGVASDWS